MQESRPIEIPSPNGQHKARLHWVGEIPFGPAYYKLELEGKLLRRRRFGDRYLWSTDSNCFAIEEWLTTDRSEGPITQLIILDIPNGVEYKHAKTHKGFIKPVQFDDRQILIEKQFYTEDGLRTEELTISEPDIWRKQSIHDFLYTSIRDIPMKLNKSKGKILGGIAGSAIGACISYALWGVAMWNPSVSMGIPIFLILGTVVGVFIGAFAIDGA
jgi:hypothetical protein